jgi:Copper type II ascorbate-dependent monooxygenase, C-terminal domain
MRAATLSLCLILVGTMGCDSGSGGSGGTASGGSAGTGSGGTGGAGGQYSLAATVSIGPITLNPSQETTVCITKRLPTTAALDVTRIQTTLAPGSHHMILYRSAETTESPTPTPCIPFIGIVQGIVPLFIAESPQSVLNYPPGVAYSLPAMQMYRLEAHYINTTPNPLMGMGSVEIYTNSVPDTITDHANLMFMGNTDISIANGQTCELPCGGAPAPTFHAIAAGTKIFGLTTHEHHLGIDAWITLSTSASDPGTMLYDNPDWSNPPLKLFDPPLSVGAGQGLRFNCKYYNDTGQTVTFGESATDEMCFIWAYYYPDAGFKACANGPALTNFLPPC